MRGMNARLTDDQLMHYEDQGYLLLPSAFSHQELQALTDESDRLLAQKREEILPEDHSPAPRHLMGCHGYSDIFRALSRDRRFIEPAMQIVHDSVYVHQFKVNPKTAFTGEAFLWHQDYPVWRRDDGMPTPQAVNIALFLDEATVLNGPLMVVPRSHHAELPLEDKQNAYILESRIVEPVIRTNGIVAIQGSPGSLLLFHANIVHGSGANITPNPRRIVYASYCAISNHIRKPTRDGWIADQDFEPIEPASESSFARICHLGT
jgi:ectoine hydroxylase